ncbi:MAG: hypothetical protein KKH92_06075 [Firmicutes bacterium]|nr:hypothetical protein [Bacillota bacterium]
MIKEIVSRFSKEIEGFHYNFDNDFLFFDLFCPIKNKYSLFLFVISEDNDTCFNKDKLNEIANLINDGFWNIEITCFSKRELQDLVNNPPFFNSRYLEIIDINSLDLLLDNEVLQKRMLFNALILKHFDLTSNLNSLRKQAIAKLIECLFLVQDYEYIEVSDLVDYLFLTSSNQKISEYVFGFDKRTHYSSLKELVNESVKQAIINNMISKTDDLIKWNNKKTITVELNSKISKNEVRNATFEGLFCLLAKDFQGIALKGSYSYKYFTKEIERIIYDLDFVFVNGTEYEKVQMASELFNKYSHETIIFSIRNKVFQSSCIFVNTNLSGKLTKIVVEILCNSLVLGADDFISVKPLYQTSENVRLDLKVNKIEISFVSKLGALSSFFRKDNSFYEKKMSSLYDINVLLHIPEIQLMIKNKRVFENYISNKIIEDFYVQTQYSYYFTFEDIFTNNIDELICSDETMNNLKEYMLLNKLKLNHSFIELAMFLRDYYSTLRILLKKQLKKIKYSLLENQQRNDTFKNNR